MGYGHAERNLALIRQLEAETLGLLDTLNQHDPEQTAWLQEVTSQKSGRAGTVAVAGPARSVRSGCGVDGGYVLIGVPAGGGVPPAGQHGIGERELGPAGLRGLRHETRVIPARPSAC